MKVCPGCRGQYEGEPKECDWCGLPLAEPVSARRMASDRRLIMQRVAFLAMVMVVVVPALAVALALVRQMATPAPAPPAVATAPPPPPPSQRQASAEVGGANAQGTITSGIESTGTGLVRIARTGGTGTYIRERPSRSSPGLAAWPDGTVLRAVGERVESEGRYWLEVADSFNHVGWVPEEYLEPSH